MFDPISREVFAKRVNPVKHLDRLWGDARAVVSLRAIEEVEVIQAMPLDYLKSLLYSMPLLGDVARKPYWGCAFQLQRIDPVSLRVGQTFIERKKCDALLYEFAERFEGHCASRGIAKLTASIVVGKEEHGARVVAHYVPPVIEAIDGRLLLVDGVHRNFLVMSVGTTIEAIVVDRPQQPYPCEPQVWDQVRAVDAKPPEHKRFFNLRKELFRDLKYVGIDG